VLVAFGATDKGRVRPINEDCFAIEEALGLCVIADGMGGHNAGEVAARLAVEAVVDVVKEWSDDAVHPFGLDPTLSHEGNVLRTAVLLANAQILERATTAEHYAGMGTTVVVTRVTNGRLAVAHVGDSRLYLFDGRTLRQVTRDDSWVATVLATDPKADPLLLQHHPMRNALTNVVGARPRTEVHVVEESLAGGELLLLTTDGVHGALDDGRLEGLIREEEHPRELAERVVSAALARGSRDNCTAIVARYTAP
jgi:PPM family protein phosphatase